MKYAIIALLIMILIIITIFIYLKRTTNNEMNTIIKKENISTNYNPSFEITITCNKKVQINIYKSSINDTLHFKKSKNNRLSVYNNKKHVGFILNEDCKDFKIIKKFPSYFEGKIIKINTTSDLLKNITISLQLKSEYSKKVYQIDKDYLFKLISLKTLFKINQKINSNYGPSTITEIRDNYLIVDIPSLGKREIYDIDSLIKQKK